MTTKSQQYKYEGVHEACHYKNDCMWENLNIYNCQRLWISNNFSNSTLMTWVILINNQTIINYLTSNAFDVSMAWGWWHYAYIKLN